MRRAYLHFFLLAAACLGPCCGVAVAGKADELAASAVKVIHIGNIELHYAERGSGTPVVFVHGSVDDLRSFQPQLGPFSQSYRAIAYSRRYNFPNRQKTLAANHSAIVEAEDLADLLRALHAYPAHIVGHSYGAYTALVLAMKHPELVRSVVLAEPPLVRWLPKLNGGQSLYDDFMQNMWLPAAREFRKGNDEQAMRLTITWFGKNGYLLEGKPAQFDTLSAEARDFMMQNSLEWNALTTSTDAFPLLDRAAMQALEPPVLLMSGQNTLQMNKLINAELAGVLPKADVAIIANATHEMWAEQPDECRARALAFFAKH